MERLTVGEGVSTLLIRKTLVSFVLSFIYLLRTESCFRKRCATDSSTEFLWLERFDVILVETVRSLSAAYFLSASVGIR